MFNVEFRDGQLVLKELVVGHLQLLIKLLDIGWIHHVGALGGIPNLLYNIPDFLNPKFLDLRRHPGRLKKREHKTLLDIRHNLVPKFF